MEVVKVPQTLEYRSGQLNAAPVLEVEIFINWKKWFMCHILGIKPQFENIIKNGPFIPMIAGQRKPEGQWTIDERKAVNLDQRLMSVLPNDQMNSLINCLTAKSTWDDMILYHEGPSDVKESRVMDLKLCYNTFKFKEDSGCSRHMTGVKSYLHKYVEQPVPKVVFGDDSTCTTKGYGSIKCNDIFDEKRGAIFNSNKEVVMIAPRVRDVYVLDITSSAQESCFFAKSFDNLIWLWHKRLAHLNFKTINKLAKQNLVIGLPSLFYSKDKPCSSCEKGKHHRASFKTKQTSSIKRCLHLFHMDLFGPVTPRSINHEKYTLVIIDEYSKTLECSTPVVLETEVSSDQNGQADQNDQSAQTDEILNDDLSKHSNQTNDEQIISNLPNTKDIQIPEHLSSTDKEDTSVQNTIPIPNPSSSIPSMVRPAPQDRWYQDKHIELVNIIGNPGAGVLTRAMTKELSTALAYECLFEDFQSEEEPKKVFEALKHPGWDDAMQDELNQFSRNKVWRLVLAPFGKTIIGSKWVFRNKRDETGIVIKNKARLVA
ncbi:retrovirus-related pol polyprotein from transposon TNT 1-94 [Tanacetum coccineum]